jgi:hypothetical protein
MNAKNSILTAGLSAGAILALAAMLSGCNQGAAAQNGGLLADGSKYCTAFKADDANSTALLSTALTNPAAAFDDCIHRWGYALASARDPADVVAQAAVNACGPIAAAWSQQAMSQQPNAEPTSYRYRVRMQQPQAQMSPQAQQIRMAESRALFYVVQARAAGCQPPPANTLLGATSPTS